MLQGQEFCFFFVGYTSFLELVLLWKQEKAMKIFICGMATEYRASVVVNLALLK